MNNRTRLLLVASLVAGAAGCRADQSTAIGPIDPAVTIDSATKEVRNAATSQMSIVLTRVKPFSTDVTVSTVIGSRGGKLDFKDAGLTMTVPAGAVSSNQTFSITALAGGMVAYEFAPHMTFAQPVRLEQKLHFFKLPDDLSSVTLGYFASRAALGLSASDVGTIDEQLPVTLDLKGGKASADVVHFSGYLMASNRSGLGQ